MKPKAILCAALCFLLCLSGCRSDQVPGLAWDASEMVELHLFQGGVPADAHRKTTTDLQEIQRVAKTLKSLGREWESTDIALYAGGIGLYLCFYREDLSREVVHLGSGGEFLSTGEGSYKLTAPLDLDALWDSVEVEAEWVGEDGLPEIGSFPAPEEG